jgi:putative transposase
MSLAQWIGDFRLKLEFSAKIPWLGGAETMKASKFSDAQKAFILKQGSDGVPVTDICRKAGISQATYFNWKKKHAKIRRNAMISLA